MWQQIRQFSESILETGPFVRWAAAGVAVLVVVGVVEAVKRLLANRLERLSESRRLSTLEYLGEVVRATSYAFHVAVGLYLAGPLLQVAEPRAEFVSDALMVVVLYQFGRWAAAAVSTGIERYRGSLGDDPAQTTALSVIKLFGHVAVWAAITLLALANLGFEITALIASLGVGGIAIALAVQNILGDLFAALSIIVDEPFVHGDFIIVEDYMGVVENIGLKTTRIRSLSGEQIVFSNQDLLNSRVRNYQRMEERRILFNFGVVYQTTEEQLDEIPAIVRSIIEEEEMARFDRAHFSDFGDSALEFEVVYYVLSSDYPVYMDTQQAINLEMVREFRDRGIEFAYPTRTVHVAGPEGLPEDGRGREGRAAGASS